MECTNLSFRLACRIASNKGRWRSFIFDIFFGGGGRLFKGGVYTREALITKY